MQDEAGGRKNRESVLTACSNHLNLLKFQMKTALMNFVLSNGLEHAVIQGKQEGSYFPFATQVL